ncbi:MAG TPA: hypothetical protein VH496_05500, partial [Mycobacterium sp.]
MSGIASTLVGAVLSPLADHAPTMPVEPPTLWALLAFGRREFEPTTFNESPIVNPLAGRITSGLVTNTTTLDDQSMNSVITGRTAPPTEPLDSISLTELN